MHGFVNLSQVTVVEKHKAVVELSDLGWDSFPNKIYFFENSILDAGVKDATLYKMKALVDPIENELQGMIYQTADHRLTLTIYND